MTGMHVPTLTTTPPAQPTPPKTIVVRRTTPQRSGFPRASREAQRFAAAILEVLAGMRTPADAAAWLSLSGRPRITSRFTEPVA